MVQLQHKYCEGDKVAMKDESVTIDFKSFLKRGKEIPLDDDQKEKIKNHSNKWP